MTNIEKYGDIEVVEIVYSDQVDDMEAAMKEVLDKYPGLDGVFCTNADITEMYLDMDKSDGERSACSGRGGCDYQSSRKQSETVMRSDVFPSSLMQWGIRPYGLQCRDNCPEEICNY